jgi:hypothetical protein
VQQPTPPKTLLRRLGALTIALAMVAGCTSSSEDDAAETPSPETSSTQDLVDAAVGIGIDTQDFQLLLDIAVVGESGEGVSFFDDVLARADEGRGEPIDLGDGLVYVPTDNIDGAIVDADGAVVPGTSIGFGLLEIADGDVGLAALPRDWIGDATGAELARSRALVIFSTTRRADGATHIGFGDQFELDVTFVDDVAPGDTVRQTTASGQALRLASDDATADDHGVFAARLAAGSAGLVTMVDDGVVIPEFAVTESVAVEGSTKTQNAIKAGLGGLTIGAAVLGAGLVCLETVGLGCAAAVLLVGPRIKFAADQVRKGNDPSCPGTRFPGPSGAGGGRDTSPGDHSPMRLNSAIIAHTVSAGAPISRVTLTSSVMNAERNSPHHGAFGRIQTRGLRPVPPCSARRSTVAHLLARS